MSKEGDNRQYELVLHFYSIDPSTEWNTGLNAGDFTLSHSDVAQRNLDISKGLTEPQVIVAFETRYIYGFNFWLKFFDTYLILYYNYNIQNNILYQKIK